MKTDPEKPVRYGITPLGLVYLGLFLILLVGLAGAGIMKCIMWLCRWLEL
jgi:hypothetical protein